MEIRIATYIQTSSTSQNPFRVPHIAIWKWIKKLPISTERKKRNLKMKQLLKRYYVYSAVDIERNELILMRVYMTRNWLVTRSFIKEVLKYCENKPKFVIDRASWLIKA